MTFTSGTVQVADAELLRKLTLYMFICVNSRHATYTLWLKQIAQQTRPENLLEEGHHTHSALINLHRAYHSDGLALQRVCIRERNTVSSNKLAETVEKRRYQHHHLKYRVEENAHQSKPVLQSLIRYRETFQTTNPLRLIESTKAWLMDFFLRRLFEIMKYDVEENSQEQRSFTVARQALNISKDNPLGYLRYRKHD